MNKLSLSPAIKCQRFSLAFTGGDIKMKKYFLCFISILSFILLTGCPGAIDSMAWEELGHGYVYYESVGLPTISNDSTHKGINGVVFSYDYNNNFIIALEKDILLPEQEKTKLISEDKYYDLLLEKGVSKYWLIVHVNDSIYGPYKKEEYLKKRQEIGVPKELKLKE